MNRLLAIITLLLFLHLNSGAQNLQNATWCFGTNTGLNFNTSPVSTLSSSYTNNSLNVGSAASVSDPSGQLLFYSNGAEVWNKMHQLMPNGNNLYGRTANYFHAQNTVIVPKPGSPTIYYLFTLGYKDPISLGITHAGMFYSVIDMSLNSGLGDVVSGLKNIPLLNQNGVPVSYEYSTNSGLRITWSRLTTTLHQDDSKIWVTIFANFDQGPQLAKYAYSYLVSDAGINNTADGTSPLPNATTQLNNAHYQAPLDDLLGMIKISPNGQYLCDAGINVILYNFNNQTGFVTYNSTIYNSTTDLNASGYGVEFSPNSQLVYFSTFAAIIQEGKTNSQKPPPPVVKKYMVINQHRIGREGYLVIAKSPLPDQGLDPGEDNLTPITSIRPLGLQLGIDNKIYTCTSVSFQGFYTWIGIITDPDIVGSGCNFIADGIFLNGNTHTGTLPQWVFYTTTIWPKVYYEYTNHAVQPTGDVLSDNYGNVFFGLQTEDMNYNVNHNGAVIPATPGRYCIQYNKTTGVTSWAAPARRLGFAMNSGDIQLILTDQPDPITTRFVNGTTGATVTGPSIPNNEIIVAEDNGIIITRTTGNNGNLYVHNGAFTSSPIPYVGVPNIYAWSFFQKSIYDPINHRLYVEYVTNNPLPIGARRLAVYSLANNTLTLINNPMSTILNGSLVQINTNSEIFLTNNNGTYKYNYINDSYTLYGNHGVNYLCNKYLEDRILYTVDSENKIYYKNTITQEVKKIPFTSPVHPFATGIFDGNTFYMQGGYELSQIGNQIVPSPTPNNFFTKLSLQSDFNFRQAVTSSNYILSTDSSNNKKAEKSNVSTEFDVILSPNPAKQFLQVKLNKGNSKSDKLNFSILITNNKGVVELRKNTGQKILNLNVSQLKAGIYHVTITNSEGRKVSKPFLKE